MVADAEGGQPDKTPVKIYSSKSELPKGNIVRERYGCVVTSLYVATSPSSPLSLDTKQLTQAFDEEVKKHHPDANAVIDLQVDAALSGRTKDSHAVVYRATAVKIGKRRPDLS